MISKKKRRQKLLTYLLVAAMCIQSMTVWAETTTMQEEKQDQYNLLITEKDNISKTEVKSESKIKAETPTETKPKTEVRQETEATPKSDTASKIDNNPKIDAESKTDANPESDAESKTDADPESDAESKTDANPQSDAESKTDANPQSDAESKTDTNPESDTESKIDVIPETDVKLETEKNTALEKKIEVKTETEDNIPLSPDFVTFIRQKIQKTENNIIIRYSVRIINNGKANAESVSFKALMPKNSTYLAKHDTTQGYETNRTSVSWNNLNIKKGEEIILIYYVDCPDNVTSENELLSTWYLNGLPVIEASWENTNLLSKKERKYQVNAEGITVNVTVPGEVSLPEGSELKVKKLGKKTNAYQMIEKYTSDDDKKVVFQQEIYDIGFYLAGKSVEPENGKVDVSIKFLDSKTNNETQQFQKTISKLIHVKDGKNIEVIDADLSIEKNGTVTGADFEIDSFSPFAIISKGTQKAVPKNAPEETCEVDYQPMSSYVQNVSWTYNKSERIFYVTIELPKDSTGNIQINLNELVNQVLKEYAQQQGKDKYYYQPGDTNIFKFKIINHSDYDYSYVDQSFILSTAYAGDYSQSETLGYDGQLIPNQFISAINYTERKIYQGLFGVSRSSQVTPEMIFNIYGYLKDKGYEGEDALAKYLCEAYKVNSIQELAQYADDFTRLGSSCIFRMTKTELDTLKTKYPHMVPYVYETPNPSDATKINVQVRWPDAELQAFSYNIFYQDFWSFAYDEESGSQLNPNRNTAYTREHGIGDHMSGSTNYQYINELLKKLQADPEGALNLYLKMGFDGSGIGNGYMNYPMDFYNTLVLGYPTIKVTKYKDLPEGYQDDEALYVALYEDEALTKRVTDPQELQFQNGSNQAETIFIKGLTNGKQYYVAEVDARGNIKESGTTDEMTYQAVYPNGRAISATVGSVSELIFRNTYTKLPPVAIKVRKNIYDLLSEKDYPVSEEKFFVSLFKDEAMTEYVATQPLTFHDTATAEAVFSEGLNGDITYYIAETDAQGVIQENGTLSNGYKYKAEYPNGRSIFASSEETAEIRMQNTVLDIPAPEYSIDGKLTITKILKSADGEELPSDKEFYAGIYADPDYTMLSDQVSDSIVKLTMNGKASGSATVKVGIDSNRETIVYVTELDENMKPVKDNSNFAYSVTYSNRKLVFNEKQNELNTIITNQEEKKEETDKTATDKTDKTDKKDKKENKVKKENTKITKVSAKTGDDTPIFEMCILVMISLTAIILLVLYRKKRTAHHK